MKFGISQILGPTGIAVAHNYSPSTPRAVDSYPASLLCQGPPPSCSPTTDKYLRTVTQTATSSKDVVNFDRAREPVTPC